MMTKRSIKTLAARKAELTEELLEINAEIAERAGETDEPKTPAKAVSAKAPAKSGGESSGKFGGRKAISMPWAPPYATAAELRSFIADGSSGSENELALAIETASRSVDRICNRQFGSLDALESRQFSARYDTYRRRWIIDTDDFANTDAMSVEVVGPQYDSLIEGWLPAPVNAVATGGVWTQVVIDSDSAMMPTADEGGIRITTTWGWPEVPAAVKLATMIQASRLFARRHAPFGILGSPETGRELRLLERLDADLMTSVRAFVRMWGAV
jgi:hypothetical protein